MLLVDQVRIGRRGGACVLFGVPAHDVEDFRRDLERLCRLYVILDGRDATGVERN
jgi:hypothetical protein